VSTPETAIRLLGGLGADDRRWILERLPVAARARLADHVEPPREVATEDFEWSSAVAQLSVANPRSLVQALQTEPAWLLNAVLRAAHWPWAGEIRKALPISVRADLAAVEREGAQLGRAATVVLVCELANRSRDWPPAQPRRTGLRALIGRLSWRSRG
jgi:hypothetical protein